MSERQHVFIVDDQADAREMVGDYLRMHDFDVTLCDGGVQLRQELQKRTPDIIVLDLNMPNEDGLSIIRYLRERCPVPVIMLTATASAIDRVVGLELGADDYLAKPCELRELLARIRSILRRLRYSPTRLPDRRLSAIVSFDIVNYTRLIQQNEAGTISALDSLFGELITPSLVQRRGLLFKMLGDGALVEFGSVVDAVEWSIWLQQAMRDHPRAQLGTERIQFRLGVAIGDVIVHQNDRVGEGVTLAVRIQEVAPAGCIAIAEQVHQFIRTKIAAPFTDGGHRTLKHMAAPVRLWFWAPGGERPA
ncbi:MAG TPA: response regulator [Beijerinckiaceae bacterium]|jgi:class 3 adenylate cyclase